VTPSSTTAATPAPRAWWLRANSRLLPDYNRKALAYWWTVVLIGTAVFAHSLHTVLALPAGEQLRLWVGIGVAMIAGLFPVRIPRSKNSFAAGEIFIFLLLLMYGPAAATLAAAGEGLIGSWRTTARWSSRIASPAMACVAMFSVGSIQHAGIAVLRSEQLDNSGVLLLATMSAAVLYFVLNTVLITAVPHLKRNHWPKPREMFGNFGWVGLVFAGSASVACLLFLSFEQAGVGVVIAAVPIIAMLLTALHTLFRQQETDDSVRQSRILAAEREAELASRHMLELAASERRFHSAFSHASIGMALVSFDARVLQVNGALLTLLGLPDQQSMLHEPFNAVVADEHAAALNDQLMKLNAHQTASFAIELRLRHRDGADVWASVNGSLFAEQEAASPCMILQVQDVTARRHAEVGLQHIAFHDILTGLPNRRRFGEHLASAVEQARASPEQGFAVMFLDFDRFKLINDSLGHQAGDEFLIQVSRRILNKLRPHDILARLGGDEFAILSLQVHDVGDVTTLADRVMVALREPFRVADTVLNSSASIGITTSSIGYTRPEDVLRDADIAMYRAKSAGKDRYALFDIALHAEVAERLRLEGDLRSAIQDGQLSVAYQPLYELATGKLAGFEALARWQHPELGAIGPDKFIPIAEESGLIVALTDFVMHRACHQLRQWQESGPTCAALTMNVNISSKDLGHTGLVARVTHALVNANLPPQCLNLELTENILMERLEAATPMLEDLRALGVGLSVDDFGTGYSSLAHLSTLPVDCLKVDRSFISGLRSGSREATVVRAIVNLGNSLGKAVVAEGIETASQFDQLRQMGCQVGQGFHMSRPLTPEAVDALLARTLADAAYAGPLNALERTAALH
jgi:diguanylate cyclase (GGDEF)-like protein/PAS domain S-box-containing protein